MNDFRTRISNFKKNKFHISKQLIQFNTQEYLKFEQFFLQHMHFAVSIFKRHLWGKNKYFE